MAFVQSTGRITVSQEGDWTRIVLPARKNWFVGVFLSFWLCGWTVGGFSTIPTLFSGAANNSWFPVFWLCGWALGWVFAATTLAWMLVGKETLWIGPRAIGRRLQVGPAGKGFGYDVQYIARAWWKEAVHIRWINTPTHGPLIGDRIAFSYGSREVKLAHGADETEGDIILDTFTNVAGIPQK